MGYTTKLTWETLRSIDSATFNGTYMALGGPLLHPSYILKIVNNSNVLVTISLDGSTDIDVVPAGSFVVYLEDDGNPHESIPASTQFFVKGVAGLGLVYLVTQYIVVTP